MKKGHGTRMPDQKRGSLQDQVHSAGPNGHSAASNRDRGSAHAASGPPRRFHPKLEDFVKQTTDELLRDGLIREPQSPWAAGVALANKKEGTLRFAIDYRRLNDVTMNDPYPMTRVDDAL